MDRAIAVCLVIAAAATAQQSFPPGGLIFWVPLPSHVAKVATSAPASAFSYPLQQNPSYAQYLTKQNVLSHPAPLRSAPFNVNAQYSSQQNILAPSNYQSAHLAYSNLPISGNNPSFNVQNPSPQNVFFQRNIHPVPHAYSRYFSPQDGQSAHSSPTANPSSRNVENAPSPYANAGASVITHGLHLGHTDDPEGSDFENDAPASVITYGPRYGAYTAVSSDEPSEATQFHSQDGEGQFLFGHSSPNQARLESRTADGSVRGSYSYINPEGRTVKVTYTAGEGGFQAVEEGSGVLPKPVTETPEVAAARALHARLFDAARWHAENNPEHKPEPSQDSAAAPPASADEVNHQPDSLYATMGSEHEDELTYYGAAKGKPVPYEGYDKEKQDSVVVSAKKAPHDFYGAAKTKGTPLAYTGAYYFPSNQDYFQVIPARDAAVLSPFSAPSLYEQQNQHRVSPELGVQRNVAPEAARADPSRDVLSPFSAPSLYEQQNQHRVSSEHGVQQKVTPEVQLARKVEDNLEYYGAAKLLAYSVGNLVRSPEGTRGGKSLESSDEQSTSDIVSQQEGHRAGKSLTAAPEPRFSSYQQAAPVFVGVGVAPQTSPEDELPSLRTALGAETHKEPVAVPPASVSQKAAFFGAVPVAAVHDAQVAPGQQVKDHQKLPVYIEAN